MDGPTGPGLERRGEDSGAPPRQARKRPPNWDDGPDGPGTEERKEFAYKAPAQASAVALLWTHWANTVVPVCFKIDCISLPPRQQFLANVRKTLMDRDGLSADEIERRMTVFAGRIKAGQVALTGKSAWGVFMATHHKLTGRAADKGLRSKRTREDWTRF